MHCLGIDVGTDSARLCVSRSGSETYYETPLKRAVNGRAHTMSATALWDSIMSMIAKEKEIHDLLQLLFGETGGIANGSEAYGICVAATCSMVVMEKVCEDGNCYFKSLDPGHEVIVWMDTRAQAEAESATQLLPDWALQQIGGRVTPEMGIAKLLWVNEHYPNAHVFELYDWVSYAFLAGGIRDGKMRCLGGECSFPPGSSAMDGSVKGWGADILGSMALSARVVGTPNFADPENAFPYVGTPLGGIGDFVVGHGCIDCYAPWAGLNSQQDAVGRVATSAGDSISATENISPSLDSDVLSSLLIVAGTSTCCIASCARSTPITGFWGPFSQLLPGPVYTCGQPASGQLFAELFAEYEDFISGEPFSFVEKRATELELQYNAPLPVLARHYFYYGDKHGNRSPYGDFRMGEVVADGVNCASQNTFQCSVGEKSLEALVLRYYLTLEFLILQTRHLCEELGPVSTVHLEGSQAQNIRFVQLLKAFVFPRSHLSVRKNAKFSGCRGIALAVAALETDAGWCEVLCREGLRAVQDVLTAKYEAFVLLASWQAAFRKSMQLVKL